jgi:hypothetical protein
MTKHVRVLLATAGVPAVVIAVVASLASAWRSRLPGEIAIHWSNGVPDNSATLDPFVRLTLLIGAGLAMAAAATAVTTLRRGAGPSRPAVGLLTGMALVPAAATAGVLVGNLDVRDWRAAANAGPAVLVTFLVLALGGALAVLVAGAPPVDRTLSGPAEDAPAIGLEAGQRAVWIGSATNRFLMAGVLVVPLTGIVLDRVFMVGTSPVVYVVLAAVGLAVTLIGSRLTATVDSAGVTVRLGLLGRPRRHFPLHRIDHAEAVEVGVFQGGGFGYRVNPFTGESLYKLRSGPALAITMRQGGLVYVTVDRPEQGAGLLNDLLRRQSSPHPPT